MDEGIHYGTTPVYDSPESQQTSSGSVDAKHGDVPVPLEEIHRYDHREAKANTASRTAQAVAPVLINSKTEFWDVGTPKSGGARSVKSETQYSSVSSKTLNLNRNLQQQV